MNAMTMSDRDCLMAIFKAVAIVHRKLTGNALSVRLETESGVIEITDTGELAEERDRLFCPEESIATHPPSAPSPDAISPAAH